jgi:hypothetical protein
MNLDLQDCMHIGLFWFWLIHICWSIHCVIVVIDDLMLVAC